MLKYNVEFLQEALYDLEEIVLYIAQDNKESALAMRDEIIQKANNLSLFPKRGRLIDDRNFGNSLGFRMIIIKSYIMFYRIVEHDVFIYRVLHGKTNYPTLLQGESHNENK